MLLLFVEIARRVAMRKAPRAFDELPLAKEIRALDRALLIGGFEDHPIAQIEREHACLVAAERRDERGRGLRGSYDRRVSLANYVHAVVVAHSLLARGYETLRFVSPENEQIGVSSLILRLVEAPQNVRVKEHLQKGVHVAAFGLELLRHRHADNFALVDVREIEGVFGRAKDLRQIGCEEMLKVVGDGLAHAAELLGRLAEKAIAEMVGEFPAPFGGYKSARSCIASSMSFSSESR